VSRWTRALLVAAALGTVGLPLVTAHTLMLRPDWLRIAGASAFNSPGIAGLLLLSLLAAIPLFRVCIAAWQWQRASSQCDQLARLGSRRQFAGIEYVEIPGDAVVLFTAGLHRPTIHVTGGAAQALPAGPFWAALLHEQAHARQHDVLWLGALTAIEKAWGWIPWTKETFRSLRLLAERSADQAALAAGASREDLFDAIVAASAPQALPALSNAGVEQRLRWIVDEAPLPVVPRRGVAALVASLAVPPGLAHMLLWAGIECGVCSSHSMI